MGQIKKSHMKPSRPYPVCGEERFMEFRLGLRVLLLGVL